MTSWLGSPPAPEFTEGLDWVNTGAREIRLAQLRGRVVLLDFWTYGCINCRHVQPHLKELERRFADSLTIIGVHAGKFAHERVTENLAAACDRQNVTHAVINDRQYRVWRSYAVQAWPTVALIGTGGELLSVQPGEFALEPMARAIEAAISSAETHGRLVRGRDPAASAQPHADGPLRFPGRVLVDGRRLVIADTGHGRELDCVLERESDTSTPVARVTAEQGGFLEPQGLALLDGALWVADRAAQTVWRIDSGQERVRALGTGNLAEHPLTADVGPQVDVRSPWGLAAHRGSLVIGMAGAHQLWRLDPDSLSARPWAGSGGEELVDGHLRGANLAQPTGVAAFGARVAFSDCESSAVRIADEAGVRTVVGKGLFAFGDKDGFGGEAQLQHPEDVAAHDDILAVPDTYNDRLKRIDPASRESRVWNGEAGETGAFREPAGISSDGTTLAIADTGNHRVVLVDSDGSIREVRLA